MTVDREQVRRDARERWRQYRYAALATEQQPLSYEDWLERQLEQAERERDKALVSLLKCHNMVEAVAYGFREGLLS